jgi:prophage antirepressor-like protein
VNEITRFNFEGHDVQFEKINGDWWANFTEVADAIGYRSTKQVERLFARHKDEFLTTETCTVNLTVQGQRRKFRLFSPKGLEHLAILGRAPKCKRFRRWILDEVLAKLHQGARLVTVEQFTAAMQQVEARYIGQITSLTEIVKSLIGQNVALAGAVNIQASSAGKLLSYIAHSPEAKAALDQARDLASGQGRISFPELDRLNGENGTAV